jgi:lysozyme
MKTSDDGRRAIMQREGVKLRAYRDSVGIPTIGVGHTSAAGPPEVRIGMLDISRHEAEAILTRDLAKFEGAITQHVIVPLEQHEFDALVSFVFNVGEGAFAKSTLLKKLNAGDRKGAADQFLVWTKAGGKTLKGLVTRRNSERAQFLGAL